MWFKEYRDYPIDKPLIQEQVEPSHGIIGCEMHDVNGWSHYLDQVRVCLKNDSALDSHSFALS